MDMVIYTIVNTFHQKLVDTFFLVWIISPCGVIPLLKGHNEIL